MRHLTLIVSLVACLLSGTPTFAGSQPVEPPPPAPAGSQPETQTPPAEESPENPSPKPKAPKPTELDLLQDPTVKVELDPVVASSLVDRVVEATTVTVHCPDAMTAEVFIVPVDAPYGGKPLDIPRSVGKGVRSANLFKVQWASKEPDQYVKLFAVVRRKSSPERRVRSHTIDLAIGGTRFEPDTQPATP